MAVHSRRLPNTRLTRVRAISTKEDLSGFPSNEPVSATSQEGSASLPLQTRTQPAALAHGLENSRAQAIAAFRSFLSCSLPSEENGHTFTGSVTSPCLLRLP